MRNGNMQIVEMDLIVWHKGGKYKITPTDQKTDTKASCKMSLWHGKPTGAPHRMSQIVPLKSGVTSNKFIETPEKDVHLFQILGVIWRGKWPILLCMITALFLGGYYAFKVAQPKYQSGVRLALQSRNQQVVDLDSMISGVSKEEAAINTELAIIRSRTLLERLVTDQDLTNDPEFNPLMTGPSSLISIGQIKTMIKALIQPHEVSGPPSDTTILNSTVDQLNQSISVGAQRISYLFDIFIVTNDPHKSALLANRLAELYIDDQVGVKFAATEYAVDWLSDRVTQLETELNTKEDTIKELRAETELASQEALEALNLRAKDIRERLRDTETSLVLAQSQISQAKEAIASKDPAQITDAFSNPQLNRIAASGLGDVASLALITMSEKLMEQYVVKLDRQQVQRDALQSALTSILEKIDIQTDDLVRITQMQRDAQATRILYETFLTRLKETSVQIGLQQPDSRILSRAVPGSLVKPNKTLLMAVSLVLGAFVGISWVLFRQYTHFGFRNAVELAEATGLPIIGQIPSMPLRSRDSLLPYLAANPTSAAAEAIRNLRTSILLANAGNPPQVLMSTSTLPGEGKTTNSIALAMHMAFLGKRVILVEADIRRRTLSEYFPNASKNGLVSVVKGRCPLEAAITHGGVDCFDVLMSEKAQDNAADLLSSKGFLDLLTTLRTQYDHIIIDTPPVLIVPDARILGNKADAIIYYVQWDKTNRSLVTEGLRQFASVSTPIAGLVFSNVNLKKAQQYGSSVEYGAYAEYGKGYYDI